MRRLRKLGKSLGVLCVPPNLRIEDAYAIRSVSTPVRAEVCVIGLGLGVSVNVGGTTTVCVIRTPLI